MNYIDKTIDDTMGGLIDFEINFFMDRIVERNGVGAKIY